MNNIRIILVRPSHPGNIGSVARAMKTMGLTELYLVSPEKFPDPEATALATHAVDILDQAVITKTLTQALENISYVYATTANLRTADLTSLTPKEAVVDIKHKIKNNHKTAILFGPENHGLNNQDLLLAQAIIQIPTQSEYHSLNLAQAVQIIAYEIFQGYLAPQKFATLPELEGFYSQLEKTCENIDFLDLSRPGQLIERLRRLYGRAELDHVEINILRGFLKAVDSKLDKTKL